MPDHPAWRSPLSTLRDAVTFRVSPAPIRDAVMAVLDRIQFVHPSVQLDALFVSAVAMANSLKLDPHEMVTRAKRMIPDVDAFSEQLNTLRDYTHGELKR